MTFSRIFIVTALVMTTMAVNAQTTNNGVYSEIGWTALKYSEGGEKLNPSALRTIVGYELGKNFSFEGMLAFGVKDDTVTLSGVPVAVDLNRAYGFYLKPQVKLSENVELFGRLGYTKGKVTASASGISASTTESDTSWGLGLRFKLSKNASVNADYMQYVDKDGGKLDGFTFGLGYKF